MHQFELCLFINKFVRITLNLKKIQNATKNTLP